MADKEKFAKIDKQTQIFKKQRKLLNEAEEKAKCRCDHQKRGEPDLAKKPGSGLYYTCKQCEKDNINLSADVLDNDKVQDAIDRLDNVLDIIKLNLRADNEDDRKILAKTARTQFYLRFMLMPLINSLKKRNNKNKNKGRNNEDSGWGKSRVI